MRRPRPAALVLAVSLAALGVSGGAAGTALVAQGDAPGVSGSVGVRPPEPVAVPETPTAAPGRLAAPVVGGAPVRVLASPSAVAAVPPVRVLIPRIGVDSRVVATGVDDDGTTQIPDDVDVLGWYRFGSAPGNAGSTVLVGHRDGRGQGRGALYSLGALAEGDRVEVRLEDGTTRSYRVVSREVIEKAAVPLDELFARNGRERLTFLSCGGTYDRARGGYQANVVVTAVPVDGS